MIELGIFLALAVVAYCIYFSTRPAPGLDETFDTLQSELVTPLDVDVVSARLSPGLGSKAKLVTARDNVLLFEQGPVPTMLGAFFKVELFPQPGGGTRIVTAMKPRAHEVGGSVRRGHAQFVSTLKTALA